MTAQYQIRFFIGLTSLVLLFHGQSMAQNTAQGAAQNTVLEAVANPALAKHHKMGPPNTGVIVDKKEAMKKHREHYQQQTRSKRAAHHKAMQAKKVKFRSATKKKQHSFRNSMLQDKIQFKHHTRTAKLQRQQRISDLYKKRHKQGIYGISNEQGQLEQRQRRGLDRANLDKSSHNPIRFGDKKQQRHLQGNRWQHYQQRAAQTEQGMGPRDASQAVLLGKPGQGLQSSRELGASGKNQFQPNAQTRIQHLRWQQRQKDFRIRNQFNHSNTQPPDTVVTSDKVE